MVAVFGDAGRATRSCIGVQQLYAGMPFEVETQFEIRD
jgi:enamine deaminase RidA (YjgF/YER057c/UK114 family)